MATIRSACCAALRWLRNFGYVDSGTSRLDGLPVPVYWLTDVGKQLNQRIYGVNS